MLFIFDQLRKNTGHELKRTVQLTLQGCFRPAPCCTSNTNWRGGALQQQPSSRIGARLLKGTIVVGQCRFLTHPKTSFQLLPFYAFSHHQSQVFKTKKLNVTCTGYPIYRASLQLFRTKIKRKVKDLLRSPLTDIAKLQ